MDNSRVEIIIFLMKKLSFSLKLVSGHFYGQSFIKTVRGPLLPNAFKLDFLEKLIFFNTVEAKVIVLT